MDKDQGQVERALGCPHCGNTNADELVWTDDEDHVECTRCGALYDPGEK